MVLRELHSDALDSLCSREQLHLLNAIDTLRSQGISHYVSLPQIIVCGDQSSGKSSVLEAISGVSFPVKSNLCTRFPTELVLRKDTNVGVRVSIVPHHSRSEVEQQSLGNFCEELDGFDGLPPLVDNAKAAMGISTHGKAFSNDLLRVEISGPDRPHLTIVDLPGLIHSETKHQSAADVQLVQEVVQSYMREPRSIILAVVSAKNDYANQIVLRLARDADPSGNRTLGVITKPDTLVANSESERMFISLAKNRDVEFRLGWHALKNMDTDQGSCTLSDRDKEERDFFSQGAWGEMPAPLVGVGSLRNRLSGLLLRQIAAELPSLIKEIEEKEEDCIQQLKKLGEPRATLDEQRTYLLSISQHFQILVKAAVDGTYNEAFFEDIQSSTGRQKRVRAVVQNLTEAFAERLNSRGHYRRIVENTDRIDGRGGQITVTRSEFTEYIQVLMKRTRGRELPGTFNPMIVGELFLEQCRPWTAITHQHILSIWIEVERFMSLVIGYIADEATSAALFDQVISPALRQLKEVLTTKCEELLASHQKSHPITYNHYYMENLQNGRAGRRAADLKGIIQRFFGVDDLQKPLYLSKTYCLQDLHASLLECTEPDMTRFASDEALDCMLAYYKVALKRFIDDVAVEVVEVRLVQSLASLFTPMKVFGMPPELVSRIAGESEENHAVREQLSKKLQILGNGLSTCRQFVGSRGVGTNLTKEYCDNSDEIDAELKTDMGESISEQSMIFASQSTSEIWSLESGQSAEKPSCLDPDNAEPEIACPEEQYYADPKLPCRKGKKKKRSKNVQ
ncbi:hypothetical protein CBS63078_10775 [Aspergillus niger]|nr:hypothetical protein CBS13152_10977 [Aspergillus niger]KAI2872055.1 hypothetical protein CBS11852_10898 [Aspergillus niger]KAI2887120.1 hypothetical protein CBS63078_10775 [Aspergillus niger]KAI3016022.1 hypothetical protein CBS147347_10903 [Aspergillus niger]KAI3034815.1 hypothetical protein CBS76997_11030 [Aspergillus niger]